MKIILSIVGILFSVSVWAANPSFQSFNTNQFGVTGNRVVMKGGAPVTNIALTGFTTGDASMLTNKEPLLLRSFNTGIANSLQRTTNQSVIMWIGDSWGPGWYDNLREKYRQQYVHGGDGFYTITTNTSFPSGAVWSVYSAVAANDSGAGFSLSGSWTNNEAGSGPNLLTATTHDLAGGITFTSRVSRFSIIYKVQAGGGTFTYSQDGGAAVPVVTAGASGLFTNVFTPSLTYGLHTLDIAITDVGTTGVEIAGVDMQNEGYGPRIHGLSVASSSSGTWANTTSNVWVSALRCLNPDTVFLSHGGITDKNGNIPIANYRTNTELIEQRLKAALPTADLIYVSQAESMATNLHSVSEYLAVQREIAITNRHNFIDNYGLFGAYSVSTNMGLWADHLHPSRIGYKSLFQRLNNFLGDGGIHFGSFSIHPMYRYPYVDHSEINIGGDTNNYWIRADRAAPAPIQIITRDSSVSYTNMIFNTTNGTTTVRSFATNVGIGVLFPTVALDVAGSTKIVSPSTPITATATAAAANDTLINLAANAVTGNLKSMSSQASVTGIFYSELKNTGAGGALSLITGGSAGDAYQRYANVTDWAVGNDFSDGGKYKVSLGGVLGTGDSLTIDTNKQLNLFGPIFDLGAIGAGTSLVLFQSTDATTGDAGLTITGNAVTGTMLGVNAQQSATVTFYNQIKNLGAGNALQLIVAGTSGDAFQRYAGPVVDWAVGNDFSDATKFKVSFGSALGTTDRFTITTNGNATIAGSLAVGGGAALLKTLTGTGVLDFPDTATLTDSDLTITVTGAADGDVVNLGVPNGSTISGGCFTAWVSAANTVTVRFSCYSATSKDPASGTFRAQVNQF